MKKILIIAYYYSPFQGVGAKRATYWGRNIERIADDIQCTVITATKQNANESEEEIIYVEPTTKESILTNLIKDEGLKWLPSLKEYFLNSRNENKYDVVVITGGPFLHFSIANLLKKIYNCKIILDFRDPFSSNPRYKNNKVIESVKKYLEFNYVRKSDVVLTVNKYCEKLISGNRIFTSKFKVIDNGYDESIVNRIKGSNQISTNGANPLKIVYAGTFYNDVNPDVFINVIRQSNFSNSIEFVHVGKKSNCVIGDNVKQLGVRSYEETLTIINSSDICLIFTGGEEFESTTKIFDYLAFQKTILIITAGKKKSGNINQILNGIPNVYWAYNVESDINSVLNRILEENNNDNKEYSTYKFSRSCGLHDLIEVIRSL